MVDKISRRDMYFYSIILLICILSWSQVLDDYAATYISKSFTTTTVIFAVCKVLNGLVSVIQSATVDFFVFNVAFGESLDPFNDLIERFSEITLLVIASLGIQKLLLIISSSKLFSIIITISGIIYVYLKMDNKNDVDQKYILKMSLRTFIILSGIRFCFMLTLLLTMGMDKMFLEEDEMKYSSELSASQDYFKSIKVANFINLKDEEEEGFFDGLSNKWENAFQSKDEDEIDNLPSEAEDIVLPDGVELSEKADTTSNSMINLIVLFIAKTYIFPLLFLFLTYKGIITILKDEHIEWLLNLKDSISVKA